MTESNETEYLPRLANITAVYSKDLKVHNDFKAKIKKVSDEIYQPHPNWTVSVSELPLSRPIDKDAAKAGLFFFEGQEVLQPKASQKDIDEYLSQLEKQSNNPAQYIEDPDDIGQLYISKTGECYVQRSIAGTVPIYIWQNNEDIWITSDITVLTKIAGHDGQTNQLAVAMYQQATTFTTTRNQCLLSNVLILNKCQYLTIHEKTLNLKLNESDIRFYFSPKLRGSISAPSRKKKTTNRRKFKKILKKILIENLPSQSLTHLSLSGGFDSTLLAILLAEYDKPFVTSSIIPNKDNFMHDYEVERLHAINKYCKTNDYKFYEFEYLEKNTLSNLDDACIFPFLNPTTAALRDMKATHQDIAIHMGGEFADEICGSHGLSLLDWIAMTKRSDISWNPLTFIPRKIHIWEWFFMSREALLLRELKRSSFIFGSSKASEFEPAKTSITNNCMIELARENQLIHKMVTTSLNTYDNGELWIRHLAMDWQEFQWYVSCQSDCRRFNPFSHAKLVSFALRSHPTERIARQDKIITRTGYKDEKYKLASNRLDEGTWTDTTKRVE